MSYSLGQTAMRTAVTMDAVLASCPTREEIASIFSDFNVSVDPGVPPQPAWTCTPGGSESSVSLSLINMFRCMRALNFDTPMPVIGATNLYAYLRSLRLRWRVTAEEVSNGGGADLHLRYQPLAESDKRYWLDPREGVGMSDLIALVVHESRHTVPGGGVMHNCPSTGDNAGTLDSSVAYGGAWAVEYYCYLWFAQHTGGQLTSGERDAAAGAAQMILDTRFCGPTAAAVAAPPSRPSFGPALLRTSVPSFSLPPPRNLPPRFYGPPSSPPRSPTMPTQSTPRRTPTSQIRSVVAMPRMTGKQSLRGVGNYVSTCPACTHRAFHGLPPVHATCDV